MTEPDFAMGTSLVAGTARGLAPLPAFLLGAEAVPLLWVGDGKVASPSLEGGQVAVLRLHAASTGHVTKPAYSCVRGMYVRCGTKVVRVPRKRRTSENPQNANFVEFYKGEVRRIPIPRTSVNKGKAERARAIRPWPSKCCQSGAEFASYYLLTLHK